MIDSIDIMLLRSFWGKNASQSVNDEIHQRRNCWIVPSAVGESLPEITGLDYKKGINQLIISKLKNKRITGFYRIK